MNAEQFQQYRPLLFALAYRMLGTVADAEDVLQEAFLRVYTQSKVVIESPKQYLTTVVTRLCLNQLTAARTQREQYLGPWLPEPLLTDDRLSNNDPMHTVLHHDSLSMAFLVLLETLSPAERAVFLLHEVFDYKFGEIAAILDKSEVACRQLYRRAKQHIVAHRPRFDTTPEQHRRLLERFVQIVSTGEMEPLMQLLAEDVTLVPDGGGQRGAATRSLRGRDTVATFLLSFRRFVPPDLRLETAILNGQPALLGRTADGQPYFALFIYSAGETVNLIYTIAGQKLAALAGPHDQPP